MSILIKGMEMPAFEHQSWDIRKGADGKWYMVDTNAETSDGEWHEIVLVPPHGRLIDADALIANLEFTMKHCTIEGHTAQRYREMMVELSVAPTIMQAEEGNL